jgi:hypothetical protein
MAKTIMLKDRLAGDVRALADSLCRLAETMEGSLPEAGPAKVKPQRAEPERTLALEDVRAVLAGLSRDGHTAKVRELLLEHGADRLSEIDPARYAALLKEAERLR